MPSGSIFIRVENLLVAEGQRPLSKSTTLRLLLLLSFLWMVLTPFHQVL